MARAEGNIGEALRKARQQRRMTQAQVADALGLPRTAVVQIESGNRALKTEELLRLAEFFGCSPQELLDVSGAEPDEDEDQGEIGRLLDALPAFPDQSSEKAFRDVLDSARAVQRLEKLLGFEGVREIPVSYDPEPPRTHWEAVSQGQHVAQDERRRQALGEGPIRFVDELLATLGIRTARVRLPEGVASVFINRPSMGRLVVVNDALAQERRRFRYAHGLAHSLLDADIRWRICSADVEEELREVRANAFASGLLMPEYGVHRYVESLGRETLGRSGPAVLSVVSERHGTEESKPLRVDGRSRSGRAALSLAGITRVAHYFGVSRRVAAHRLRNLRLITQEHLESLEELFRQAEDAEDERVLKLPSAADEIDPLRSRLAMLAAEARSSGLIGEEDFERLADLGGVARKDRQALIELSEQ